VTEASVADTVTDRRCDLLLPKVAYLSQDQWEASGCHCIRRAGHEGICACDCWIDNGKVTDDEAHAYLRSRQSGPSPEANQPDSNERNDQ
jgi:hypothetical protein